MSSFALAQDFRRHDHRRHRRLQTIAVPWKDVPVGRFVAATAAGDRRWIVASALIAIVIAAHSAFVWYVASHVETAPAHARKHKVEVQIVSPPPPPPLKVEPPKPQPPRQLKRQVLPQIQTAAPDTPAVETVPSEPPIAVAPSAPEPAPPPPPPQPEVVSAPFGRAGYLNNPPPSYPAIAARQGWQGTVLLRVRVLSTGRVDTVEVQKSSGHKLLDDEAVATVRGWQFAPSKRGETPIDGWATVPIEFKVDT